MIVTHDPDVDECSSNALNNCHKFANTVCNNTIGSFDCNCNSGYNTSDGENCTGIYKKLFIAFNKGTGTVP